MNLTPEVLAALIAAIAAVSSVIVSLIAVRRSKKNKISSIYTDISERYDNLIRFRTQHPQVLPLSRKWETRFLKSMYYPVTDEDKQWVIYFTYVELCIGYCSSVLMARANKLLDGDSYENQYLPLVRLLLTEHAPIIGGLVNEKKICFPVHPGILENTEGERMELGRRV